MAAKQSRKVLSAAKNHLLMEWIRKNKKLIKPKLANRELAIKDIAELASTDTGTEFTYAHVHRWLKIFNLPTPKGGAPRNGRTQKRKKKAKAPPVNKDMVWNDLKKVWRDVDDLHQRLSKLERDLGVKP